MEVGDAVPELVADALREAAARTPPSQIEVVHDRRTFDVLAVHVPELGAWNLYGTDITAAKVVERFPGQNPNPVLRMTPGGDLLYANDASRPITAALGLALGQPLPSELFQVLQRCLADPRTPSPEVAGAGGLTFRLKPVAIPEFGFVNLYGTDITAEKAITKFPDENPNPVLRLTRDGRLTYANPAAEPLRLALSARIGEPVDRAMLAQIEEALVGDDAGTVEMKADGRTFSVRVVRVFEFDSINLYGTDITAARQVEALSQANEGLLLNILPASIAERLRGGETIIADRFEDMAVLFADVVDFTSLSARLSAAEVVSLLNEVFTACDRLADDLRLEKIKTVGDAYMVVGGLETVYGLLPGSRSGHAADMGRMGLAIIREVARLGHERGLPLAVRVGMNVGPAVAGVIGLKKFIYDVWGDTVNTASRMESTGVPGRVQITRATVDRLGDQFHVERRGLVDVKGKGQIETWFLLGERG